MRPVLNVRKSRPVQVAVGALMLVIPTSAVALSAGAADAQSALQVSLNHQTITYGQSLIGTGVAPPADAGRLVSLELAPSRGSWRTIASARVPSNGRFRIVGSPPQSGSVRVLIGPGATAASVTPSKAGVIGGSTAASDSHTVAVRGVLRVGTGAIGALAGSPVHVRGRLLPGVGNHVVVLEGASAHGWRTLASTDTRAAGRFDLRYTPRSTSRDRVRVRFAGDRFNGGTATPPRLMTSYHQSVASWYDDGGATACGFHSRYGVANKDLPCGTHVTFRYGGRTVTATVDDRGPFVGGRDWDLNQNIAGALHFDGVATVWSSR